MAEIKCAATDCMWNRQERCAHPQIEVDEGAKCQTYEPASEEAQEPQPVLPGMGGMMAAGPSPTATTRRVPMPPMRMPNG